MELFTRRGFGVVALLVFVCGRSIGVVQAQGLGGAGTIQGTIKDPTGGVMQSVAVTIGNPVSRFRGPPPPMPPADTPSAICRPTHITSRSKPRDLNGSRGTWTSARRCPSRST